MSAQRKTYNATELAKKLGCNTQAISDALNKHLIEGRKVSNRWQIKKDQEEAFELLKDEISATKRNAKDSQDNKIDPNAIKAEKLVMDGENVFVTGKAGTGKTYLLKKIRENLKGKKTLAVLAPTGVAAENAEGYTMHSFLRLPLKPYLPNHTVLPSLYQLSESTAEVVANLDVLIIDEISMVRCDMLDATDMILRHYRGNRKPFGGVQIIMFGDLYQLCPVVKSDEEKFLREYYKSMYFFSSYVLQKLKYKVVELEIIHRQDEPDFIKTLNNVREAKVEILDLNLLDNRYQPNFCPNADDGVVTLMTHIRMTDKWNETMFCKLKGKTKSYRGEAHNWYGERFPVRYNLELKVGSRVMFQRNSAIEKQYVNGTMGWVREMQDDTIRVEKDDGGVVWVERAKWEQFDYFVDKETKTIYTEVSGTYKQFPLKLAWAVSIHKSQGLTFDEVAIDASKSFTFGQVYVALSRCKTLEGIHLLSKIPAQSIIADDIVRQYLDCVDKNGSVNLPEEFDPIKYEKEPLHLPVKASVFDNIKNGRKKNYNHTICNIEYARKMFLYRKDNICANRIYSSIKQNWHYRHINNGHCPFVIRQYKKVVFECEMYWQKIEVDVAGTTEVYQTKDTNGNDIWAFRFKIGEIKGIKSLFA